MSKSAVLCYGYVFPPDHEFPWSYLKTVDDWYWFDVAKGGIVQPYLSDSKNDHAREWIKNNPIPFTLVKNKDIIILSCLNVKTESLIHITPFPPEVNSDRLLETQQFCQRHNIQLPEEPQWTLLKAKMPNRW